MGDCSLEENKPASMDAFRPGERIRHCGWLALMRNKRAEVIWKRRWFYLLNDRLCYATVKDGESQPSSVKYISLDRISVRPRPHKYSPKIGVTMTEDRQVKGAAHVFSIATGSHTYFLSADTEEEAVGWVRILKATWLHCFKHTKRSGTLEGEGEAQIRCQALEAENIRLSTEKRELKAKMAHNESSYYSKYVDEVGRTERLEKLLKDIATYEVRVKTGKMKGSGTDARVYIEIFGVADDLSSGEHPLKNINSTRKTFQKGQVDRFTIRCENLGVLAGMKVWHDSTGRSPEWFLEEISIRKQGAADWVRFPCNRWLAVDLDDGRICRLLMAGEEVPTIQYRTDIYTSDLRGAGTDANVFVVLHGTRRDSRRLILTSGHDDFERGQCSSFTIDEVDVGEVEEVTVGHDGTGSGSSWHLDYMIVVKLEECEEFLFPCRQWFDEQQGDGKITRRLKAQGELDHLAPYEVVLYTTDERGSGTDSEVFVIFHGEYGDTEKKVLPSEPGSFQRGRNDKFRFEEKDVGQIGRITLGLACTGSDTDWHCHYVRVKNEANGEVLYFECNDWLGNKKGQEVLTRTLCASRTDPEDKLSNYEVRVFTSDVRGGGTDANVAVALFGSDNTSGDLKLPAKLESFERGTVDRFSFRLPFLGDIRRVRVWHDNTGHMAGWHLQKIEVVCNRDKKVHTFPCNDWLAKEYGDGKICREIEAGEKSSKRRQIQYQIAIRTSNVRGAGTDARVSIELSGNEGRIGPFLLDTAPENFERNKEDVFVVYGIDIGTLEAVVIQHDNSGMGPEWHLDTIEVRNLTFEDKPPAFFVYRNWIDSKRGLKQTLKAHATIVDHRVNYKVQIVTSDIKGAGTDANIEIDLVGKERSTGFQKLTGGKEAFEKRQTDSFALEKLEGVADVVEIVLKSDGTGPSPSWHVSHVLVDSDETNRSYFFPVQRWIDVQNGLQVRVEAARHPPDKAVVDFDLNITTSNIRRAGTDANVFVQLVGNQRTGQAHKLEAGQEAFERGREDKFRIRSLDVGTIEKLKVWHDGKSQKEAWHLDSLTLRNSATGEEYFFSCGEWLDARNERCKILEASRTPIERRKYEVVVFTSTIRGAGTDANVYIEVHGDLGSTGELSLDKTTTSFGKGQVDEFVIVTKFIGIPKSLAVWHNGTEPYAGWHLDMIKVTDQTSRQVYFFECNQWLDKSEGDGATRRVLQASLEDPKLSVASYKIIVHTGKVKGAGTDANVFIEVFGERGSTGKRSLDAKGRNDFEKGQMDEFSIECKDLGRLCKIHIGHDGKGLASSWNLSHADIINTATGQEVVFPANLWLGGGKGSNPTEVDLFPVGSPGARSANRYRLRITTSDTRGAGTDATVFVKLCGISAESDEIKLDDSQGNPFERGQVDTFDIDSCALGEVKMLKIRQDGKGSGPDWHLKMVELTDLAMSRKWYFWCNDWVQEKGGGKTLSAMDRNPLENMNLYKVIAHTSKIKGAGTDANVWIDLFGTSRSSGPQALKNKKKDTFERGEVDEFAVELPCALGSLLELKIWHDAKDRGAGWHLDHVVVQDVKAKEVYYFLCQQWLDKSKEDGRVERVLKASRQLPVADYLVTVHTSNLRGAGTDAGVFIEIYGKEGKTKRFVLDNPGKNDFERGNADAFEVHGRNVGRLTKILIGHDNKGLGSAWHVHKVQLLNKSTGQFATFPCDKWFSETHDDKKTEREFMLSSNPEAQAAGSVIPWQVVVFTGDVRGAGTDADVFVELIGKNGKIGPHMLEATEASFERGMRDSFRIFGPAIGPLKELVVRQNGKGRGPAWFLESVEITDESCGKVYLFKAQRWLDKSQGMMVTLSPLLKDGTTGGSASYHIDIATAKALRKPVKGRMNIKVIGGKGDTGEHALNHPQQVQLEPGTIETFYIDGAADVGKMTTLTLAQTFNTPWRGVVTVVNEMTHQRGVFIQDAELNAADGISRLSVTEGACDYELEIKTSDIRGAGTDASVFITMFGGKGQTGPHVLHRPSPKTFERNQLDVFLLDGLPDLGELRRIEIGHDGSGFGAGWHLAWVKITNRSSGTSALFKCERWLDKSEEDGQIVRTLLAEDIPGGTEAKRSPSLMRSNTSKTNVGDESGYKVTFWTSNVFLGGTNGQVYFELIGEAAESGILIPAENRAHPRASFDRGVAAVFMYPRLPFLGALKELKVGLDSKGIFPGWHLRIVEVEHVQTGARWRFQCHGWVDKRCGFQRVLRPDNTVVLPNATI